MILQRKVTASCTTGNNSVDLFGFSLDSGLIQKVFGDAVSTDFMKTLAIFTAAAYVHGRKVSLAIKNEVGELTRVVRLDLDQQQKLSSMLIRRVDRIEEHLHIKGE